MTVDVQKEKKDFERALNGRFQKAIDKGFIFSVERYNDGGLNKRWRGWLMHAYATDFHARKDYGKLPYKAAPAEVDYHNPLADNY